MSDELNTLGIYLHLARASELRRRPLVRDKMLVLAGMLAADAGLAPVAACCRQRILAHNPGHLISHYPDLSTARADERFQGYLRRLRRNYSRERAEHMLHSLGIEIAGERATYFTDYEYAASLLGTTPEALDAAFAASSSSIATSSPSEPAIGATTPATRNPVPWRLIACLAALAIVLASLALWWKSTRS